MNLRKLLFYLIAAIYRCSFLVPAFFAIYLALYHFRLVGRNLTLCDMIVGFIGSVIVTTAIDYLFKSTYVEIDKAQLLISASIFFDKKDKKIKSK